jgi:hypothetical protein
MTKVFRGNPRLLLQVLPVTAVVIVLKCLYDLGPLKHLDFSPLLTGVIAGEIFIVGFILSGTAADFKEAERLPGEVAGSLDSIADECLIVDSELKLPEARQCVFLLADINASIRRWLLRDDGLDDVFELLRRLNSLFYVFAPKIQAGFTTRLKGEQANVRKLVIRMETMRRTSYVSAGYLLAEVTGLFILVLLLITQIGQLAPTLLVVGVITYLLAYAIAMIRDIDNPFEYHDGRPGPADVDLGVLECSETRLRGIAAAMGSDRGIDQPSATSLTS